MAKLMPFPPQLIQEQGPHLRWKITIDDKRSKQKTVIIIHYQQLLEIVRHNLNISP